MRRVLRVQPLIHLFGIVGLARRPMKKEYEGRHHSPYRAWPSARPGSRSGSSGSRRAAHLKVFCILPIVRLRGTVALPGETESGSAEEQPDKG
jgi:hypothetical protein